MMRVGGAASEIGILVYPGAQMAAVHGLTDILLIASRLASEGRQEDEPPLQVTHWSPDQHRNILCVYRSEPQATSRPGILILPPTLSRLPDPDTCTRIADWLQRQHAQGVRLVAVCSGVFLIAGTGLLDGRIVSTHRRCARALVETYPKVTVDTEARMIEHGDLLTAGGFMAWVDVGLILIERLLGGAVRTETARFIRFDPFASEEPHFAGFTPRTTHGDLAVIKAQEFIHIRDGQGIDLALVAAAAGLERRTLLRRFAAATGMTPVEYCRAVRLARARELLEAGTMPLQQIAASLGYADVSAFSRAFRRSSGVAPGTYRQKSVGGIAG
ncbi:GlxA family transcriptional regulator [Rubellimicrobium arenae]|uniref:GlxA family transcriptional regulator n=1 Tax=Rubellimicrobium arenae TaxID=2817372 RepID=UPI001B315B93|nr:helix-turn-helix domain-containing protein [Rubellimicrobium arenae]